jgi:hypothetical protein
MCLRTSFTAYVYTFSNTEVKICFEYNFQTNMDNIRKNRNHKQNFCTIDGKQNFIFSLKASCHGFYFLHKLYKNNTLTI